METKKKGLRRPKPEVFFLLNHYSRGIWCYIRPDFVGLFPLIKQRSNLDGGTPKSRWGTLNLDGGTLKLDGGTRPPYNLSTDLIPPSISELENCGLVESSTEVVLAGYIAKKVVKRLYLLRMQKMLNFYPEAESHSAF